MVLDQEPAHIEREGTAKPRHLIFRDSYRAVCAWTEKTENTG